MRHRLGSLLAAFALAATLAVGAVPDAGAATGLEGFDPGYLMSDEAFFDDEAMDIEEVQAFLDEQGESCVNGPDGTPCLKDYWAGTPATTATTACTAMVAISNDSAAGIITRVAGSCGVSPHVLLVLLQKEQGLITASGSALTAARYAKATGAGCPDFGTCDPASASFFGQLYSAATKFQLYRLQPNTYRFQAGSWEDIGYHPESTCGSARVLIQNQATAGLYNYTPYVPNEAALASSTTTGDACSSYGTRNFYRYLREWFPESASDSTEAPILPTPVSTVHPGLAPTLAKASALGVGVTGAATGPLTCDATGCVKPYQTVSIHWSAATGAHSALGAIRERWTALGRAQGFLGYPVSDEFCGLSGGGCAQHFQGGSLYHAPTAGTWFVLGAIRDRWAGLGWEGGSLGYPTSDEFCGLTAGGCAQHFQNGSLYHSPATGTWVVRGAIRDLWASLGWEDSPLGYPVTDERCAADGSCTQTFQRGRIDHTPAGGPRVA